MNIVQDFKNERIHTACMSNCILTRNALPAISDDSFIDHTVDAVIIKIFTLIIFSL